MDRPFALAVAVLAALGPPVLLAGRDGKDDRVLRQRTERFDTDPGWDGHNNRVTVEKPNPVVQDFGYGRTNHAGGRAAGEVGGRVQRCTTPATYGRRFDPPRTLGQELRCSGTFAVTQTMGSSSLYFGWFNSTTMDVRPRNFLGLMLNGEGRGAEVYLSYTTAAGQSDGFRATGTGPKGAAVRDFNLIPTATPYTWELVYDPDANGGTGAVTFTLGGRGPFTGGPFTHNLSRDQRKAGATFDSFGIVNPQSAGNWMTVYFDDLTVDGEAEPFDRDPGWAGRGNREQLDDHGREGAHRFRFSDTALAGGKKGELGGLVYSSPSTPGYYADKVGRLTLDDRLTASGKVALIRYGSDGGVYVGWFDSRKRGHPPANVLGVLIDGPTSTGPRFRGCVASSDPKAAVVRRDAAAPIAPDGTSHAWKIEYRPDADGGARPADGLARRPQGQLPAAAGGAQGRRGVRPVRAVRPRGRRAGVAHLSTIWSTPRPGDSDTGPAAGAGGLRPDAVLPGLRSGEAGPGG